MSVVCLIPWYNKGLLYLQLKVKTIYNLTNVALCLKKVGCIFRKQGNRNVYVVVLGNDAVWIHGWKMFQRNAPSPSSWLNMETICFSTVIYP